MTTRIDDLRTSTLLTAGFLAALLGFLGVLAPDLAARLAGGIPILNAVGIAALLLAGHTIVARIDTDLTTITVPDVRTNTTGTLTGHRLDTVLTAGHREARDRIRTAVRTILATDFDEDTVQDKIADGTWTDDRTAGAFLSGTVASPDGLWPRLRDRLTTDSRVHRQARHAVDALLAYTDTTLPETDAGAAPRRGDRTIADLKPDTTKTHSTDRWIGVTTLPLLAVAVAVFTRSPGAMLVAGVGIAVLGAVQAAADRRPDPSITVDRRVADEAPGAGDSVRVTVTVTNEGDSPIPDLRICDGVPPALHVDRGTPATATMLRPGETVEFTYAVTARAGNHTFDPPYVLVRDVAGTQEWLARPTPDGATALACVPPLNEPGPPNRTRTTPYAGRVDTETGGQGVEFYGTREYRRGDPLARVNWKRLASTGELSTIDFRRERAAAVVLLVDTRSSARVAPTHDAPNAVDRSVQAARTLAGGLLAAGDQVGLGTLGPTTHWTPPSAGADHRAHLRRTLANNPAFSPRDRAGTFQAAAAVATFRARLTEGTNLIICSPLVDDWVASVARRLAARTAVTVVSPDPTGGATVGTRLAAVERDHRISILRSDGITVLDWDVDEALDAVLTRHRRR